MRVSYHIATKFEGSIAELFDLPEQRTNIPTLEELLDVLGKVTFIAETVAHLHGKEEAILPWTDKARELIDRLQPLEPKPAALGQG